MLQLDTEWKIPILDAISIRYVLLRYRRSTVLLITQAAVTRQMETFRAHGVSADEVGAFEKSISSISLAPDWSSIRAAIMAFPLEENLWETDFVLCACTPTVVHGYMTGQAHRRFFNDPVVALFDGIAQVHALFEGDAIDLKTGVHLLKQVAETIVLDENLE